jgi:hypothetical protein
MTCWAKRLHRLKNIEIDGLSLADAMRHPVIGGAPLPQDNGAHTFTGPIDLHAVPVRADENSDGEWLGWPPGGDAP